MGAYLNKPQTEKESEDKSNELLAVGSSSMQGWRCSQEDAHNAILNFDTNASYFAVYDGHGGAEVATYSSQKLPQFLKDLSLYKEGDSEAALKAAFLEFDKSLLAPSVKEILNDLATEKNPNDLVSDDVDEDDEENLEELHEESHLPLNEVLEKYKGGPYSMVLQRNKDQLADAKGVKLHSPCLRGRRAAAIAADAANKMVMDPDAKPAGSSTSAAAAAAAAASVFSKRSVEVEEGSTVSSSTSAMNSKNVELEEVTTTNSKDIIPKDSPMQKNEASKTETENQSSDSALVTNKIELNGKITSTEEIEKTASKSTPVEKVIEKTVSVSQDTASSSHSSKQQQNGSAASSSSKSKDGNVMNKLYVEEEDSTDDDADYDGQKDCGNGNDMPSISEDSSDNEIDEDDEDEEEEEEDDDQEEEDSEEEVDEDDIMTSGLCGMVEVPGRDSGCTAVVALLQGRDLYVANAGDSRCIVSRDGKAIEMSLDHKPEDEEESVRIIKAGGRVTMDGRVNGGLNLSRALGDHAYKLNSLLPDDAQMISPMPDIKKLIITPADEFMVLACDGIWNYMSNEEVVDFVRSRLSDSDKKLSQICEELFDHCLAPNTLGDGTGCDNMTAIIVVFKPQILQLPTKIDPTETEDVIAAQRAANTVTADASMAQVLKRSSACEDGVGKKDEDIKDINFPKRLKTDDDEFNNEAINYSRNIIADKELSVLGDDKEC